MANLFYSYGFDKSGTPLKAEIKIYTKMAVISPFLIGFEKLFDVHFTRVLGVLCVKYQPNQTSHIEDTDTDGRTDGRTDGHTEPKP